MKRTSILLGSLLAILFLWQSKGVVQATTSREAIADSLQDQRDRQVAQLLEKLKGKEQEKAGTIFPELKNAGLRDLTVERFLRTMNVGYSRGLGMGCNGCHNLNDFADESNEHFGTSRQMAQLVDFINLEAKKLPAFANKRGNFTNCFTCHQGHHEPPRDRGAFPQGQGRGGERPQGQGRGGN